MNSDPTVHPGLPVVPGRATVSAGDLIQLSLWLQLAQGSVMSVEGTLITHQRKEVGVFTQKAVEDRRSQPDAYSVFPDSI